MSPHSRRSLHERIRNVNAPSPSAEHYLRATLLLAGDNGVRVTDLAEYLGVTKATVTITSRSLIKQGFFRKGEDRCLYLTEPGKRHALRVCARHALLHFFLEKVLGLERENVEQDVCRIEHAISDSVADRLYDLVYFYRQNGDRLPGIEEDFSDFHRKHPTTDWRSECAQVCDNVECRMNPRYSPPSALPEE